MSAVLSILAAGPGVTVQDKGRSGYLSFGVTRGGAADRLALSEGAALLGQSDDLAALEMAGMGVTLTANEPVRFALCGAPMKAFVDGDAIGWNASHELPAGARLAIGAAQAGCFGYLHVGGGIDTPPMLGARGTHLAAGLGRLVEAGDTLPIGPDAGRGGVGQTIDVQPRFSGGTVRLVPGFQSGFFAPEQRTRFTAATFTRDARGNRMGVRLIPDGEGFESAAGLNVLSEVIAPGDVQITGDGTPFVLLADCQTTGGYPRIGSVLPCDLPIIAQAPPGATLRFAFLPLEEAVKAERRAHEASHRLRTRLRPLVRDPHDIADLLTNQLISGATAGDDLERNAT